MSPKRKRLAPDLWTHFGVDRPVGRRLRERKPFAGLAVAESRAEFSKDWGMEAYRTSGGLIYMLCPFHFEKTPSCVWYPGRKGIDRTRHFHCYGCGKEGGLLVLVRALRHRFKTQPYRPPHGIARAREAQEERERVYGEWKKTASEGDIPF